jgi:hypothetical protein
VRAFLRWLLSPPRPGYSRGGHRWIEPTTRVSERARPEPPRPDRDCPVLRTPT